MAFRISTFDVSASGRAGSAYILESETARAEVWPTHGFNCLRWQTRLADGSWGDLLYTMPDWETNPVPTRSGHPVLFPFPNRMAGASFDFAGTRYDLPKTESTGKHAIHGFTPRAAWRVVGAMANDVSAAVTGEFRISVDAPSPWPADATLRLTYTLLADRLRVDSHVSAADGKTLPFGLGYHGYFRLPTAGAGTNHYFVEAAAHRAWELQGGLPTRQRPPVRTDTDFRAGRTLGTAQLDHLFGSVGSYRNEANGLCEVARLSAPPALGRLSFWTSAEFRELLLFTPAHRNAVAVEPYTCATDAMNFAGVDGGWLVLPPGAAHTATVEYRWDATFRAEVPAV